jgi:hypothetical protein
MRQFKWNLGGLVSGADEMQCSWDLSALAAKLSRKADISKVVWRLA